ncbi:Rieske 2Fe-2S domain-containing protein, partial [Vibrio parahaemolyticus]
MITCLSNVCTHRGNLLVTESCNSNQLRCGYHGRCFSLNGSFASTPGFETALDFPAERDNLTKVPIGFFDKFVFVGVDP